MWETKITTLKWLAFEQRIGSPVYIRLDQIVSYTEDTVETITGGPYMDLVDVIKTIEEAGDK
jgi:hypothetical protein